MTWLREPNAEPLPGYRLLHPLGTGGFGEVWKCEAPGGICKAIKFVYGNLNSLDGDAARAEQELKALLRVKEVRHPFVLSMDRIEVVEGELLIVMELADKSLYDLFLECQTAGLPGIPRDDLVRYLRDAADGLDHLIERHNLQHLDVKPRNLFLIANRAKVADFGLVKHLERQSSSGLLGGVTPIYAAPETFCGQISKHSDQYSLAVVYIELLTGQKPFNGRNIRQLAIQHMTEPPDLRMIEERDRPAVARALAKEATQRFPNCLAFIRALSAGNASSLAEFELAPPSRLAPVPTMPEVRLDPPPPDSQLVDLAGPADLAVAAGLTKATADVGVLRPTLLIGVGGFGRRALLELRCRLLDLFGELAQVPTFRFLYIDSDPEADRKAGAGTSDVALTGAELFPVPLQPVGNYRRRTLEHLNDWLPREKLYTISRSLQPHGSRALARLAFSDNYLRFLNRVKRELQIATHPEAIAGSVRQTGLVLRDPTPRVYVFAAANGGSSGALADLGFALRAQLAKLHYSTAPVVAMLYCGAPNDPVTPKLEQANLFATLTELNHYHDPSIAFSARYGPDGPSLASQGQPFSSVYLLPLQNRSAEELRHCVAHLASYVAKDLTTPLNVPLDHGRAQRVPADRSPFRSFGTANIWFPRGLLLRVAARQVCQRLLAEWQAVGSPSAPASVDQVCQQALADPALRWDSLAMLLEQALRALPAGGPGEVVTQLLTKLEEQAGQLLPTSDPGPWVRQAVEQLREAVGVRSATSTESMWRKSRVNRVLAQVSQQLAIESEERLAGLVLHLMDLPGRRLATTEAALGRLARACEQAAGEHALRMDEQSQRTRQAWAEVQTALDACQASAGGFSLFGGRQQRSVRHFLDQLGAYARQRLAEEFVLAGVHFYQQLQGRLEERMRDLTFCRQRLRHLQPVLGGPFETFDQPGGGIYSSTETTPSPTPFIDPLQEAIRGSATLQIVLPYGETDLEQSATQFVQSLRGDDWSKLEQVLQALVLAPLGGLHQTCQKGGDLVRYLVHPLIDQTVAFLSERLPIADVAQVEFSATSHGLDLAAELQGCYDGARPLMPAPTSGMPEAYLLVPAGEAGDALGKQAQTLFPELKLVPVTGQTDLTFCREQGFLTPRDLYALVQGCRSAYQELATTPTQSPHARFDVQEWMPLEP